MKTAVSNVAPGQVVKFYGEPCIVLEHRTTGTLLVTAAQIKKTFGSTNNFAVSSFREHLNGAFADVQVHTRLTTPARSWPLLTIGQACWRLNEMPYYKTCPDCGAHLDPGERCDCKDDTKEDCTNVGNENQD